MIWKALLSKKTISILVMVILAATLVKFLFNRTPKQVPYKDLSSQSKSDIPSSWDPMPLVNELYTTMSGLQFWVHPKEDVWRRVAELPTDAMVVLIYNNFNESYFAEHNQTLTQWIQKETGATFNSHKPSVLNRLGALNLK